MKFASTLKADFHGCAPGNFHFFQASDFSELTLKVNDQTHRQGFQSNHFQNTYIKRPGLEQPL